MNGDLAARLLEKRAELALLKRQRQLIDDCGIVAYQPHEKQDLFHRAGRFKLRGVFTGNRFGKSTCAAAEDVSWALGYRPFYPEGDPARYEGIPQRSVKGLILVSDWPKSESVFTSMVEGADRGKLFKMLPKDAIVDVETEQSGYIAKILIKSKWGGVSTISMDTVASFKRNKVGQESDNWDFIHVDEPCPKKCWVANSRGLMDSDGSAWFTCTITEEVWIYDMFCPPDGIETDLSSGYGVEDFESGRSTWMIDGSTHDNTYMTDMAIKRFALNLSEEEKETRLHGKPSQLTGAVYKEFDRSKHVMKELPPEWKDWLTPPANYAIRVAIDTHPSNPTAVLFCATSPHGYRYYYAELYKKLLISDLKEEIWNILRWVHPMKIILEQAAYNDNPTQGGLTIADELIKDPNGLRCEKAVKDLQFGILKVKACLKERDHNGVAMHRFSPMCHETIREFDRYTINPETGKPYDRDDHMMENLYRLNLMSTDYIDPYDNAKPVSELQIYRPKDDLPALSDIMRLGNQLQDRDALEKRRQRHRGVAPLNISSEYLQQLAELIRAHGN